MKNLHEIRWSEKVEAALDFAKSNSKRFELNDDLEGLAGFGLAVDFVGSCCGCVRASERACVCAWVALSQAFQSHLTAAEHAQEDRYGSSRDIATQATLNIFCKKRINNLAAHATTRTYNESTYDAPKGPRILQQTPQPVHLHSS